MAKSVPTIEKVLNNLAKNLMDQVPNDIRDKTDGFLKEVSKVVKAELEQADERVKTAETKAQAIEKRISDDGKTETQDELFLLIDHGSVTGTWPTLFRASDPTHPLFCIRMKKHPEQPVVCGAHCSGFKSLKDGNVELCNGSVRQIER